MTADQVSTVGWLLAFAAGLLSFFSPCVVPIVPGQLDKPRAGDMVTEVPPRLRRGHMGAVRVLQDLRKPLLHAIAKLNAGGGPTSLVAPLKPKVT